MKNLVVTTEKGICTITINRPKQLNALNKETIAELGDFIGEIEKNNEIKVIILTGAGEKAFVAGADIKEFAHFNSEQGKQLAATGHDILFDRIENLIKPVIAAINGFALGGGLELAMACHLRVACDNAKMGLPETSLGLIPGYGGTQRLSQLIGRGRAMEMICTAKMINANEAQNYGLVNHVVPQEELMLKCKEIANAITKNSSVAIGQAIEAINAGYLYGVNGYNTEINAFGKCFDTADFKEGSSAFIDKRKPKFLSE